MIAGPQKEEVPETDTLVLLLDALPKKLGEIAPGSSAAKSETLSKFATEFLQVYQKVENIFKEGGTVETEDKITFERCTLPAHNWDHISKVVEMVIKLTPGFLATHPETTQEQMENVLWAALFHDLGWLINSRDKNLYQFAEQKFFTHCRQSAALVESVMKALKINLSEEQFDAIRQIIMGTEFNFPDENTSSNNLAKLLRDADFLSYFCRKKAVPDGPLSLWQELQILPNFECPATNEFITKYIKNPLFLQLIKQEKGIKPESKTVTIFDIKYNHIEPRQTKDDFVSSTFMHELKPSLEQSLRYLDKWYYGEENPDRVNYDDNIWRIFHFRDTGNWEDPQPHSTSEVK